MQITSVSPRGHDFGPAINIKTKIPIAYLRNNAGVLNVTALGTANWVSNSLRLGPDSIGGRAAAMASLFSRWEGHHFEVQYTPGCPSSTTGMIAHGITTDPNFNPALAGDLGSILQLQPSEMCNIWTSSKIRITGHQDDEILYTDSSTPGPVDDARLEDMGRYMIIATGLDPALSQFLGTLVLCMDLDLYSPCPDNGVTLASLLRRKLGAVDYQSLMQALNDPVNLGLVLETLHLVHPQVTKASKAMVTLLKRKSKRKSPPAYGGEEKSKSSTPVRRT